MKYSKRHNWQSENWIASCEKIQNHNFCPKSNRWNFWWPGDIEGEAVCGAQFKETEKWLDRHCNCFLDYILITIITIICLDGVFFFFSSLVQFSVRRTQSTFFEGTRLMLWTICVKRRQNNCAVLQHNTERILSNRFHRSVCIESHSLLLVFLFDLNVFFFSFPILRVLIQKILSDTNQFNRIHFWHFQLEVLLLNCQTFASVNNLIIVNSRRN